MQRLLRAVIAGGAIVIITACSLGVPASGSGASPSATLGAAASCRPLDLRTPSGARVDLSGTWHGNDDAYYSFLEVGNCVWATGTNRGYVLTLQGTATSDFTVPFDFAIVACGRLGDVLCATHTGTATFAIEFESGADGEIIVLRVVVDPAGHGGTSGIGVTEWTRVSEAPLFPPPTPGG